MNQLRLGQCLGAVSPPAFQRLQNERLLHALSHQDTLTFNFSRAAISSTERSLAHLAGTNCLAIDNGNARFLISGGADATIRLWDLESLPDASNASHTYIPTASLPRGEKSSHTHSITSISIYPFDPEPTTLLTTAHDKSLKLTAVNHTGLIPVHTFSLDFAPYTHAVSPVPDSSALVAVGTAHPAVRLLDLRSGLSTHSLPGHNGAVYALNWSPKQSYILASGAHDGRVLFFDIRRANAAFASLDLDDAVGVSSPDPTILTRNQVLSFNSFAHTGPVTSVQWTPHPHSDKLVTTGHDQRIRVWDAATGRNDLVHFGPRVRNDRIGTLSPLLSPAGCTVKPSHEMLLWPNDDGRGDIFVHNLHEGNMLNILRTKGLDRAKLNQNRGRSAVTQLTSAGRINALVWRVNATGGSGLEMYSAHGDGSICAWTAGGREDGATKEEENDDDGGVQFSMSTAAAADGRNPLHGFETAEQQRENKRKRKRDFLGEMVQGLTKKPLTFS